MKGHITVLAQRRPGHKVFAPAVVSGPITFIYPDKYRKRADAIKEAKAMAESMDVPYKEPE